MEIKRPAYLEQLKIRENNGLVKVITGMRRCGKSYLLFKLFLKDLVARGVPRDHIITIALDEIANDRWREPHALYDHVCSLLKDQQRYYIFLDEIQYVDRFHEVLNGFLHLDNVDVYVTGSNSRFLSSDILTEFRGRGDEVRVYPLSFAEYVTGYKGSEEDAFNDYLTFGGLPRILALPTDAQKSKYLTDLFQETYLKDILERHNIRNVSEMEALVNILASAVGSLTNPKKLAHSFHSLAQSAITDKTVKSYLDYLRQAFLIDTALRYDIKGKRYINTPLKIYFNDIGLRNARLGFRQIEETHLLENLIFIELKRRGFSVDVGLIELREKGADGSRLRTQLEVDFIAYQGNNKYYLQSAFAIPDARKRQQEERPLLQIDDSFKKLIIVGQNLKLKRDEKGITTMGIRQFLLDPDSLEK